MAKRFLKRRLLVPLCLVLLLLIGCWCVYVHYEIRMQWMGGWGVSSDLAELREAFFKFREIHHRWPHTIEEAQGIEISDGIITWPYKDPISGLPYRCITDRGLYHQIDGDRPARILVMQPRPYRTRLWPFGDTQSYIVTCSGVRILHSPSEIIDLGDKQDFDGEFPDYLEKDWVGAGERRISNE